ncbi:MAG: hypothetical protein V1936_01170 [Patescibacteria group bacterium]
MPINQSIWKIGNNVERVNEIKLESEAELENILQKNIAILNEDWLVIGRQVPTKFNKYIDLLAIDITGSLIVIELKKDKTPRDVVAQSLDYASWVASLSSDEISTVFEDFDQKYLRSGKSLDEVFSERFNSKIDEENLDGSHQIIIVATELDSSSERIVSYLDNSNVPINIVFFKVFEVNGEKFINRAWFIDPYETSEIATTTAAKEPWNGEFYVSFGESEARSWTDAKKYGFISGGGGIWHSRTLNQLKVGDRVWVNVPSVGYVGVGKVTDTARKADEVFFESGSKKLNIYELSPSGHYHKEYLNDEEKAEYIVKINWEKAVEIPQAVSEIGFFGNQNTVCKPTKVKWGHTIERLKSVWEIR